MVSRGSRQFRCTNLLGFEGGQRGAEVFCELVRSSDRSWILIGIENIERRGRRPSNRLWSLSSEVGAMFDKHTAYRSVCADNLIATV